jgi:hypothetical protein
MCSNKRDLCGGGEMDKRRDRRLKKQLTKLLERALKCFLYFLGCLEVRAAWRASRDDRRAGNQRHCHSCRPDGSSHGVRCYIGSPSCPFGAWTLNSVRVDLESVVHMGEHAPAAHPARFLRAPGRVAWENSRELASPQFILMRLAHWTGVFREMSVVFRVAVARSHARGGY